MHSYSNGPAYAHSCAVALSAIVLTRSLDVITAVRYQIIVIGNKLMKRVSFTTGFLAKCYVGVWVFSLTYAFLPYMGSGEYVLHPSGLVCYADTEVRCAFADLLLCRRLYGDGIRTRQVYIRG